ncbi:hypothetical protein [Bifidobacterium crudilactis]|uniref:hypothetical protein n=1 Tax=Bifidobacterium crudilactis TaxID=327277 RepID=UPI0005582D31|nr:hypothetical protein [Bifidobacterium crudilactis]
MTNLDQTHIIDSTGDNQTEMQSNRKRAKLIVFFVVGAVILACGITGGILYANHLAETKRQQSLASCEKELKQFKTALTDLDRAKTDVAETVKISVEQVADGATVVALAKAVAVEAPKTVTCPAEGDTETLDANTAKLVIQTKTVDSNIKAIRDGAAKVTESKTAKEVADALKTLTDTIASGEQTLSDSDGKVSDNAVREQLREALDSAIDVKESKDIQALGDHAGNLSGKVQAVGDAVNAKAQVDAEAATQAAAAAQAAANAKKSTSSGTSSGTSSKKTASSGSGTTTKKSTGSTGNSGGSSGNGNSGGGTSENAMDALKKMIDQEALARCKADPNRCS